MIFEVAFGPLELTHDEFWDLTPYEFMQLQEGYRWREKRKRQEANRFLAYILATLGKNKNPQVIFNSLCQGDNGGEASNNPIVNVHPKTRGLWRESLVAAKERWGHLAKSRKEKRRSRNNGKGIKGEPLG